MESTNKPVVKHELTGNADRQPDGLLVPGTRTFRKAVIETENMNELTVGIICGQACGADLIHEYSSMTSTHLAKLFIEIMISDEPGAFNVGFLLGLVDALLHARKIYPRGW